MPEIPENIAKKRSWIIIGLVSALLIVSILFGRDKWAVKQLKREHKEELFKLQDEYKAYKSQNDSIDIYRLKVIKAKDDSLAIVTLSLDSVFTFNKKYYAKKHTVIVSSHASELRDILSRQYPDK